MLDSMSLVSLDTLAIARKLQAAGFSDVQADAVTGVIRDSRESDLTTLVTRSDLSLEIALVRSDLRVDIALVRSDLRTEIADTRYEILTWVLSAIGFQTIVVVGAVVALTKGLH
jgi:hypothetical protein